jgi:hypothetical protein
MWQDGSPIFGNLAMINNLRAVIFRPLDLLQITSYVRISDLDEVSNLLGHGTFADTTAIGLTKYFPGDENSLIRRSMTKDDCQVD